MPAFMFLSGPTVITVEPLCLRPSDNSNKPLLLEYVSNNLHYSSIFTTMNVNPGLGIRSEAN